MASIEQFELFLSLSSSNTFSIQNAGFAYESSGMLYTRGCNVNNSQDCSTACQDPIQIFSNPYTLQNCMVLSAIAPNPWTQSLGFANLSQESVEVASFFAINTTSPDFQSLASNVTRTIQGCSREYADFHGYMPWYFRSIRNLTNTTGVPIYDLYCPPEMEALNADIGGIGVYISYWMQSGIALSGFVLLKLCENQFYRWCIFFYYVFWPFGFKWPIGLSYIKRKASILQAHLCTYSSAIKSALVEFHKAQCFFILAIEIAAKIVVRQGTLNDGTTTLQGLFNNYSLVGSVSISGFVPVTFTLLALHRAGMHSWYLVILSHIALVLSAVTMFNVGDFVISPADMQKLFNVASGSSYCSDPTTFCLNTGGDTYTNLTSMDFGYGSIGGPALLFTCIILALIDLDRFGLQRTSKYRGFVRWLSRRLEKLFRSKYKPTSSQSNQHLPAILKDCLYFCIWVWYITFIALSLRGLYYPSNGAVLSPVKMWTFGQIVAITVWAGPLFEFVKLSVQGLKKGLKYRTPDPYTITNSDDAAKKGGVWFKWSRPIVEEEPLFNIF